MTEKLLEAWNTGKFEFMKHVDVSSSCHQMWLTSMISGQFIGNPKISKKKYEDTYSHTRSLG